MQEDDISWVTLKLDGLCDSQAPANGTGTEVMTVILRPSVLKSHVSSLHFLPSK